MSDISLPAGFVPTCSACSRPLHGWVAGRNDWRALLLSGKILITLAVIGSVMALVPIIYSGAAGRVLAAARAAAGMP